jgi:hypothetical protein
MELSKLPFNVYLLSPDKNRLAGLLPVQSMDIYNSLGEFNSQGLFSVEIFGEMGSSKRQVTHSFIDMRTTIMHPKIYSELVKLKSLYGNIMKGTGYAQWNEELKDFVKSDIIDGETGYSFFEKHFHDILYYSNESTIRDLRIKLLTKLHDKCMYRYLVVLPAGLRDIELTEEGRTTEDEINTIYRKILRVSNTISVYVSENQSKSLDVVRWSLQSAFNDLYSHIESVLQGKKGFMLSKWASRSIHNSSRNVITAMDASPRVLGSAEAISINDTACGLHQYLKTNIDTSIYNIKTGPMQFVVNHLPSTCFVVDKDTLKRKEIIPSMKVIDIWGSESGIEKTINNFNKTEIRHKPIYIDDKYYAALLYRDSKSFKVFYDIDELPERLKEVGTVSPITWAEMFYIAVYLQSKKVAAYITRYPINDVGSIYPSFIYLQTTIKTEILQRLNDNWDPVTDEFPAIQFPIKNEPFYDSMSVHPTKPKQLGADFDGDKCSLTCVTSDEAIAEATQYLNSKEAFINTNGDLRYGVNNNVATLILYSFTRGLINDKPHNQG